MSKEYSDFEALGSYTTFGVAARCARFIECDSEEQLLATLRRTDLPQPVKLIGGGSNLLFTKPFEGTIVYRCDSDLSAVDVAADGSVTVSASVRLDALCERMCELGWWEFANLSAIPGTVGGAAVQNAGAYGMEMSNVVKALRVYNAATGHVETMPVELLHYGYRQSSLKSRTDIYILSVIFLPSERLQAPLLDYGKLRDGVDEATLTPTELRRVVTEIRRQKLPDPAEVGSAGSFFRNPEVAKELVPAGAPAFLQPNGLYKVSAAWLIDRAGLKGSAEGGAALWSAQPLVIVNKSGDATACEILRMEQRVVATVEQKYNIKLTPEVEHL